MKQQLTLLPGVPLHVVADQDPHPEGALWSTAQRNSKTHSALTRSLFLKTSCEKERSLRKVDTILVLDKLYLPNKSIQLKNAMLMGCREGQIKQGSKIIFRIGRKMEREKNKPTTRKKFGVWKTLDHGGEREKKSYIFCDKKENEATPQRQKKGGRGGRRRCFEPTIFLFVFQFFSPFPLFFFSSSTPKPATIIRWLRNSYLWR